MYQKVDDWSRTSMEGGWNIGCGEMEKEVLEGRSYGKAKIWAAVP